MTHHHPRSQYCRIRQGWNVMIHDIKKKKKKQQHEDKTVTKLFCSSCTDTLSKITILLVIESQQ